MGRAKDQWLADQERGFSAPDTHVCDRCVDDGYLKDLIQSNTTERRCSYCGRRARKEIAAPAEVVIDAIAAAVHHLYADPTDAGVPYDGGWVIEPTDTADVLMSLPLNCNDGFFEDVVESFGGAVWVPAGRGHWISPHEHEALRYSWDSFVHAVKHETRFHFAVAPVNPDAGPLELAPGHVLPAIGRVVTDLALIQVVDVETAMYRARQRDAGATWEADASTMGAPPPTRARAGRMNPAGISYFYCALEPGTAVAEVASSPPIELALSRFEATRDLVVLNLCNLPPVPSLFDAARGLEYEWLTFLHGFVDEISQPVRKDGQEHIDYVPTQVLCEWFAQVYAPDGRTARIDGLLYPSAVAPGGKNLVLFPTSRGHELAFDTVKYRSALVMGLGNWAHLAELIAAAPRVVTPQAPPRKRIR